MTQASKILLGSTPVLTSSSEDLFQQFKVPTSSWALFVFKDSDSSTPAAVLRANQASIDTNTLSTWLLHNRLPTSMELNQESFQSVMNAPHKPLVVIVATFKEHEDVVREKLRTVGLRWRAKTDEVKSEGGNRRGVVFTWMDRERWGSWLKGMYGIKEGHGVDGVVTVVVDHEVSCVFVCSEFELC
jgi:thioredoxin domain-containing protein 5